MGLKASSAQAKFIRQAPDWITISTMFNQPIRCGKPFTGEAQPEDRWFAACWLEVAQERYRARSGGHFDVIEGIDSVRKGAVTGAKLIFSSC